MKSVLAVTLVFAATTAGAQTLKQDYPSCDLKAQHALMGDAGGSAKTAGQDHIAMRANVLEADLGNARKARRLTQRQTDKLFKQVEAVRNAANGYARKQGFLSAAERATYDRQLDAVAMKLCRR